MEIFLSAEIEGPVTSKWFLLQKEFTPLLKTLESKNYGETLTSIGIITILLRDKYLEDGGYKERRYYSKKNKEADIRLRINYYAFLKASDEEARKIYVDHILQSIRIAGVKAGKGFDLERLIADVQELLI